MNYPTVVDTNGTAPEKMVKDIIVMARNTPYPMIWVTGWICVQVKKSGPVKEELKQACENAHWLKISAKRGITNARKAGRVISWHIDGTPIKIKSTATMRDVLNSFRKSRIAEFARTAE